MVETIIGIFIICTGFTVFVALLAKVSGFSLLEGLRIGFLLSIAIFSLWMTCAYGLYFIFRGVGI